MSEKTTETRLGNGTVIRHRVMGYEGIVDGITEIKNCFTSRGEPLGTPHSNYTFQYRIAISGESLRRIAPLEDLEILEGTALVLCPNCRKSFQSVPGALGKPRGRCQCGAWICPTCFYCQAAPGPNAPEPCAYQRKRLVKRIALAKKTRSGKAS